MKSLVREIHRRSLWQVLGIYLAGSWIALQVVETLKESMSLPDWVQGFSVVILILGLPIVLATAFVQEGVGRRGGAGTSGAGDAATGTPDPPVRREAEEEPVSATTTAAAPPPPRRGGRGILTWKRAVIGGIGAFALLGVSMVGWVVLRSMGIGPAGTLVAKGLLEARATLLLTDFTAEDAALSRAATEAIRVDLDQSNVIDVADPGFVSAALARMQRPTDQPLTAAVGRELAEREGMPAIITGEVTSAGTGYVLTAQIETTGDGTVLVSDRETAADDGALIPSIDRLSRKLRERIGESLGDLASTPSLERVTTANLEALRAYSRAVELADRGDNRQAADLLEEAVAMDTSFAMAWRKLGVELGNRGENAARRVEALTRAFELRDRLTERERLLATAGYYGDVDKDPRREADAYERMLENDPDDTWATNNLALVVRDLGDLERAESLLRRTLELEDSSTASPHWNLSVLLGRLGRYEEADVTLDSWRRHLPDDPLSYLFEAGDAAARREYDRAVELALEGARIRPGARMEEAFSRTMRSATAAVQGRAEEAATLAEEAANLEPGSGNALYDLISLAFFSLESRGDEDRARAELEAALERFPLEEMGTLDPPWDRLVELESRLNGAGAGRLMLERWEAADPNATRLPRHVTALAWIDIADGRPGEAARRLVGVLDGACLGCPFAARAEAWRLAGPTDSAAVYGERYVEHTDMFRVYRDASVLAPQLERLGGWYDELGDLQKAANYYAQFVDLWSSADDEFQPRVRAAQARLEEILKEIG